MVGGVNNIGGALNAATMPSSASIATVVSRWCGRRRVSEVAISAQKGNNLKRVASQTCTSTVAASRSKRVSQSHLPSKPALLELLRRALPRRVHKMVRLVPQPEVGRPLCRLLIKDVAAAVQ